MYINYDSNGTNIQPIAVKARMELRAYHLIHVRHATIAKGVFFLRNRTEDWYARIVEMYSRQTV